MIKAGRRDGDLPRPRRDRAPRPTGSRTAGLGRSFQLCRIFPRMTVLENMLVAVQPHRLRSCCAACATPTEVARARTWLRRVGIDHLERAEARDLSFGQQKLLELAAVSWATRTLVLLDEPAGGVNPALIDRIADPGAGAQRRGTHLHHRGAQHGTGHGPVRPRHRLRPRPADRRRDHPRSCRTTPGCWRRTLVSETALLETAARDLRRRRGRLRPGGARAARPVGHGRGGAGGLPRRAERRRQVDGAQGGQRHAHPASRHSRASTVGRHRTQPAATAGRAAWPMCCRGTACSGR